MYCQVYWGYWGTLFATLLTWVFAVSAAADDAWVSFPNVDWGLAEECTVDHYETDSHLDEACSMCKCCSSVTSISCRPIILLLLV